MSFWRGFFKGLFGIRTSPARRPRRAASRKLTSPRQHAPRQPRARGRRPADYFPWQEKGDDLSF
jgi:hypothetical protein